MISYKQLCSLLLLCISGCLFIDSETMNNNLKTLNTEMEESLQKYVHSENISQVLVAVSVPNQKTMLFTNSKASLNKSEFPIASITKTFTAALTLKLFQQGKLKLDNNLGQYFPQYPKWSNITVQMLLNQTSGLPDYINTPNFFIRGSLLSSSPCPAK